MKLKKRETIKKFQGLNLYIKYIEEHVDENALKKEFEKFGNITSLKIVRNDKGVSRGFGYVCYEVQEQAQKAIDEAARILLPGCMKPLYVTFHESREIRSQRLQQLRSRGRSNNYQQNMYYPPPTIYATNIPNQNNTNQQPRINKNPRSNKQNNQVVSQSPTPLSYEDQANKLFEIVKKYSPPNADRVTGVILNSPDTQDKVQFYISNEFELKNLVEEVNKFLAGQEKQ